MADEELVLYELSTDGTATLRFNRPERNNAMSHAMERRYFELLDRASDDPDVRAIVLTGSGRSFCPGMDIAQLETVAGEGRVHFEGRRPQTYTLNVTKPLIAAINGACAGIGLLQALLCDIRFAARGARFTTAFARRGLVAEHGISWLLPRMIGIEPALDLLLSGRVFDADEAESLGLVSRVYEPEDLVAAARAYADDLARNCSPLSMAIIKRQVWRHLEIELEPARQQSIALTNRLAGHPDFVEGVASFTEKRSPKFEPLPPGFQSPAELS